MRYQDLVFRWVDAALRLRQSLFFLLLSLFFFCNAWDNWRESGLAVFLALLLAAICGQQFVASLRDGKS